jgi:hypothetical protein
MFSFVTKEVVSLIVQLFALCAVVVFASLQREKKISIIFGAIVMFLANIVGQIYIAGGGPGACVGTFLLPLLGILVAWMTVVMANFVQARRHPSKRE